MLSSGVRVCITTLAVVAGLLAATHVNAQTAVGTVLENGQIIVKIYVTMNQVGFPSGRPIGDYTFVVIAPSGERSSFTTSDAGTTELRLAPGAYRVISLKPLVWYGHQYMWDLALDVRQGMRVLDLTPNNAVRYGDGDREQFAALPSPAPAAAAAAPSPAQPLRAEASSTTPPAYLYKSPGEAALFSFLIPGVGQMYNGQVAKGVGLLLISTGAIVVGAAASTEHCGEFDCSRDTAPLAVGGGVFLATWIYSMFDAYSTAKQRNAKLGFRVGAIPVSPHFGAESDGRTTIGLSLAVR